MSDHKKMEKLGAVLLLSNRARGIHVPSTCSFRLCLRTLPTIQTRDKETISEQEIYFWTSLLVHLGRDKGWIKRKHLHMSIYIFFFFRGNTVTSTYIFTGLSVSELCHILRIQPQLESSILISTACLDTILKMYWQQGVTSAEGGKHTAEQGKRSTYLLI